MLEREVTSPPQHGDEADFEAELAFGRRARKKIAQAAKQLGVAPPSSAPLNDEDAAIPTKLVGIHDALMSSVGLPSANFYLTSPTPYCLFRLRPKGRLARRQPPSVSIQGQPLRLIRFEQHSTLSDEMSSCAVLLHELLQRASPAGPPGRIPSPSAGSRESDRRRRRTAFGGLWGVDETGASRTSRCIRAASRGGVSLARRTPHAATEIRHDLA